MRFILAGFVCVGLCFGALHAQTPPKEGESLNDLMALRAKVMVEARQLQLELRQTWNDPAFTSPEIEKLRKKIQDLQDEIVRTHEAIGAKVEALPQNKEKSTKLKEMNKQIEELNKKIEPKQGITAIMTGESPKQIYEKLTAYVTPAMRNQIIRT